MFLKNKYTKWYHSIVNNRKNSILPLCVYTENHHIVPQSLGGNNKAENIVALTAKEHFICHRLLVKMTSHKNKIKMSYAIRMMMHMENEYQQRYAINSRTYAYIISETKRIIGENMKGKHNHFYNKKHSEKSKKVMKEKRALQHPPMLGKHHSEESKQKLRDANKDQFKVPYQRELRRIKSKELWANTEWRAKYKGNTGKSWYYNKDNLKCRFFYPSEVPDGWIKGRIINKTKKKEA